MSTNYDSARFALAYCQRHYCVADYWPVELLLPADDRYRICTPSHLAAALGLCGLDAVLFETRAVGAVTHEALRQNALAVCCAGLHSTEENQRWMVAVDHEDRAVEFYCSESVESLLAVEPAHFRPVVIVVYGPIGRRGQVFDRVGLLN